MGPETPEGPYNFTKKTQRFRFSHIFLCCDLNYPTNFQNPPIRAFRDNIILLFSNGVDFHPPHATKFRQCHVFFCLGSWAFRTHVYGMDPVYIAFFISVYHYHDTMAGLPCFIKMWKISNFL